MAKGNCQQRRGKKAKLPFNLLFDTVSQQKGANICLALNGLTTLL